MKRGNKALFSNKYNNKKFKTNSKYQFMYGRNNTNLTVCVLLLKALLLVILIDVVRTILQMFLSFKKGEYFPLTVN